MKKSLIIFLTLVFVFAFSNVAFADETVTGVGGYDYYYDYYEFKSRVNGEWGISSNNSAYNQIEGKWSSRQWVTDLIIFPSECCVFIDLNSVVNEDGYSYYNAYVCTGTHVETFVSSRTNFQRFRFTPDNDGSIRYFTTTSSLYAYQRSGKFYFSFTSPNTTGAYSVDVPICTSYEDAEMFMTTGDYMYLWNYEKYIDVPTPKNVSMYEASTEKGVYVYWEHSQSDLIYSNYTVHSNVSVSYLYKDASGNDKSLTVDDIDFVIPNYSEVSKLRNQHFISYEPLLLYDTGFIQIDIWDDVTLENGDIIFGDVITLKYFLSSGEFTKQVFDKDGNSYDDEVITSTIPDYGTKNDSFTGGNPIISNIDTGDNSDFSIIGGLTSLFGLLGDNGVIKAMKHTFSFYPDNIYTIIYYGLFATIVISLYNRATK